MKSPFRTALILNTYNQPEYLARVLQGVSRQRMKPDELLIADDGSTSETLRVIEAWKANGGIPCRHFWQQDLGFRKARILNQVVAGATSDYLVFLDGDSIPHPCFLSDHIATARKGAFVQGHRCLIGKKAAAQFHPGRFARLRALARLQIGGVQNSFRWPYPVLRSRTDLEGIRGCNFAAWRNDLLAINGYNEEFEGWGREDSELAARLMNSGVVRVDVRGWAVCYHLWHPPTSRARLNCNEAILTEAQEKRLTVCARGIDQHLGQFASSHQPRPPGCLPSMPSQSGAAMASNI